MQFNVEFYIKVTHGWYIYADQSETTNERGCGATKERWKAV